MYTEMYNLTIVCVSKVDGKTRCKGTRAKYTECVSIMTSLARDNIIVSAEMKNIKDNRKTKG